jgi:hypothetical protein
MNNKYLAIVLSVVAVIVVLYQIFFRKPAEQIQRQLNQPVPQSQPHYSSGSRPGTAASASPGTAAGGEQSGPIIDYNSEILLKRIPPELTASYSRRELPPEFGKDIFSRGIAEASTPDEPQYEREVEFKLNAIILDDKRRIAIINNKILEVGDVIQGAEVIAIVKSSVVLKIRDENLVLSTNARIKRVRLLQSRGQ